MVVDLLKNVDFIYEQRTGLFHLASSQDVRTPLARGYSGKGIWRNDPSGEDRIAEGPIPRGVWRLGAAIRHPRLGSVAIPLEPFAHKAHGRSGFFIHGDSTDGDASRGCIILPRRVRELVDLARRSGATALTVV